MQYAVSRFVGGNWSTGRWTTHSSGKLDTKYTVILLSLMSQSAATMTMGRNTFCQSFGFYFYFVVQSKYRFWQEAVRWKTFSNPPKKEVVISYNQKRFTKVNSKDKCNLISLIRSVC